MTLEKAYEPIAMHSDLGSGYNRNVVRMALGTVMRDHGQQAVDDLLREYELEAKREIKPGIKFESAFKS